MKSTVSVIVAIFLATVVSAGAGVASAQGNTPGLLPPPNIKAANGPNPGESVVSWDAVDGATYYRIGWIAYEDYEAVPEGQDWLEAFSFTDVTNRAQTSRTVTRLTPGTLYAFIVASNDSRYGEPQWSQWATLELSDDRSPCPTTETSTPIPTPTGDIGTKRSNSAPFGASLVDDDGLEITLLSVDWNANERVAGESQRNDPPSSGNRFVIVSVKARRTGGSYDESTRATHLSFEMVSPRGIELDYPDYYCGVFPDSLGDNLYLGAETHGNLCFEVPFSETQPLLRYERYYHNLEELWFALPQPDEFVNCTELRQAYPNGVDNTHPAYRSGLDRDNDGRACEPDGT